MLTLDLKRHIDRIENIHVQPNTNTIHVHWTRHFHLASFGMQTKTGRSFASFFVFVCCVPKLYIGVWIWFAGLLLTLIASASFSPSHQVYASNSFRFLVIVECFVRVWSIAREKNRRRMIYGTDTFTYSFSTRKKIRRFKNKRTLITLWPRANTKKALNLIGQNVYWII